MVQYVLNVQWEREDTYSNKSFIRFVFTLQNRKKKGKHVPEEFKEENVSINPFTSNSAKSRITNWVQLNNTTVKYSSVAFQ